MTRFNWNKITNYVANGVTVQSRPHGISAEPAHLLTKAFRGSPALKSDHFTARLHELTARTGDRYLTGYDREQAFADESPVYFVSRDGRAIAYVTKGGQVVTRDGWRGQDDTTKREADALNRLRDALATAAKIPHRP